MIQKCKRDGRTPVPSSAVDGCMAYVNPCSRPTSLVCRTLSCLAIFPAFGAALSARPTRLQGVSYAAALLTDMFEYVPGTYYCRCLCGSYVGTAAMLSP